jgi:hypothetical protein
MTWLFFIPVIFQICWLIKIVNHQRLDTWVGLAGLAGSVGMALSASYGTAGLMNDGLQAVRVDLSGLTGFQSVDGSIQAYLYADNRLEAGGII